jgi:hypothetical protein
MGKRIGKRAREELLEALRQRYAVATKTDKGKILDEFVAVVGCHRKHAVRLLRVSGSPPSAPRVVGRRIYDEAVKEALTIIWEAGDRICGKRLKAVMPELLDAMEHHGHMDLDPLVRKRLLSASASTIDRLLSPIRRTAKSRPKRRAAKKANKKVAVKTFSEWDDTDPGFLEIDFVAHCGGSMAGAFIHTLGATDVCTGWIEVVPLLAREQSVVVEALEVVFNRFPIPVLGINSDNDSAFINDTLINYCGSSGIEFTRSRPYRKNDQAWIEQKNGSVIRRFVGYDRYSGLVAGQALAHLFGAARLYVNFFQPSFKLLEKIRHGAKVTKRYDKPATPCDRLLAHEAVSKDAKQKLQEQRSELDPLELLHRIRKAQAALAALGCSSSDALDQESLDAFLAALPRLWRAGEVRPTHRKQAVKPRQWRTRRDPFEGSWPLILEWLQSEPDATAKSLLERLQTAEPEKYSDGQVRTLQRRIKEWREIMAKKLFLGCIDGPEEITPLGAGPSGVLPCTIASHPHGGAPQAQGAMGNKELGTAFAVPRDPPGAFGPLKTRRRLS